jgi:hypothetical protein
MQAFVKDLSLEEVQKVERLLAARKRELARQQRAAGLTPEDMLKWFRYFNKEEQREILAAADAELKRRDAVASRPRPSCG